MKLPAFLLDFFHFHSIFLLDDAQLLLKFLNWKIYNIISKHFLKQIYIISLDFSTAFDVFVTEVEEMLDRRSHCYSRVKICDKKSQAALLYNHANLNLQKGQAKNFF